VAGDGCALGEMPNTAVRRSVSLPEDPTRDSRPGYGRSRDWLGGTSMVTLETLRRRRDSASSRSQNSFGVSPLAEGGLVTGRSSAEAFSQSIPDRHHPVSEGDQPSREQPRTALQQLRGGDSALQLRAGSRAVESRSLRYGSRPLFRNEQLTQFGAGA